MKAPYDQFGSGMKNSLAQAFSDKHWDMVYMLLPDILSYEEFFQYNVRDMIEMELKKLINSSQEIMVFKIIVNIFKQYPTLHIQNLKDACLRTLINSAFLDQKKEWLVTLLSWGANPLQPVERFSIAKGSSMLESILEKKQYDLLAVILENMKINPYRLLGGTEQTILKDSLETLLAPGTKAGLINRPDSLKLNKCLLELAKTGVPMPVFKSDKLAETPLCQAIVYGDSASLRICFAFNFLDLITKRDEPLTVTENNPSFFLQEFFKFAGISFLLLKDHPGGWNIASYISRSMLELTIHSNSRPKLAEIVLHDRIEKFLNDPLRIYYATLRSKTVSNLIDQLRSTPDVILRKKYIDDFLKDRYRKGQESEERYVGTINTLKELGLADQILKLKEYKASGDIYKRQCKQAFLNDAPFFVSYETMTYISALKKAFTSESIEQCTYNFLLKLHRQGQIEENEGILLLLSKHDLANQTMCYTAKSDYEKYEPIRKRKHAFLQAYEDSKLTVFEFSATTKEFIEKFRKASSEEEINAVLNEFFMQVTQKKQEEKQKGIIVLLCKYNFWTDQKTVDMKQKRNELTQKINTLLVEFDQIKWRGGLFEGLPDILKSFIHKLRAAITLPEVSNCVIKFLDNVFYEEVSNPQNMHLIHNKLLRSADLSPKDLRIESMIAKLWEQGFVNSDMIMTAKEKAIEQATVMESFETVHYSA